MLRSRRFDAVAANLKPAPSVLLILQASLLGSTPEPVKHIVTSPNTIKGKNILCTCLQLFRAGSRQLSAKRASRWTYHVYIKGSWQQVHSAVNSLRLIQP